jgi:gas vesicle protein
MSEQERPIFSNMLVSFVVGAAVGAAVAYLTAPRTGRETREKIRDLAWEARDAIARVPQAVSEAATRSARAAKDSFSSSMREGEKPRSDA